MEYDFNGFNRDLILEYGRCLGRLRSAVRGKRGQRFLRDMVAALDVMPVKELYDFGGGRMSALDAVAAYRGADLSEARTAINDAPNLDRWADCASRELDIAPCLAGLAEYNGNDFISGQTPAQRWARAREWAVHHIADD